MFSKAIALFALIASVRSGAVTYQSSYNYPVGSQTYVHNSPHVGLQSEQTVRGFAGQSISHQQKAIDSPFSSVRKTDTRITNPGLYATAAVAPVHAAPVYSHSAPVYQQTYAAAPVHAAPVYSHSAPVYHQTYAAAPVHAAPVYSHPAPVYQQTYAAAPVAKIASPGLLGVQYSAVSPAVASLNFNGYGISYGY